MEEKDHKGPTWATVNTMGSGAIGMDMGFHTGIVIIAPSKSFI